MAIERSTYLADAIMEAINEFMPSDSEYYCEPYQNGREHGWCLVNLATRYRAVFSNYRNTVEIVVYCGKDYSAFSMNNIPTESTYANKRFFAEENIMDAALFVINYLETAQEG